MDEEYIPEERKRMINKVLRLVFLLIATGILVLLIIHGEIYPIYGLSSISGILLGFIAPCLHKAAQDCTGTNEWQTSLRKLLRGKLITNDSLIRISFAYLYRIQIDGKYMLIRNKRGTKKYQPVGGVYKYEKAEKDYIAENYHVVNDNKIINDKESKDDYRLYVPAKYLKCFVERFDSSTAQRELISNVGREFTEELIRPRILDFSHIEYRYCGRHFTTIEYSRVFNCYELLLADIVELKPTGIQEESIRNLMKNTSSEYVFVTADEIKSCGVRAETGDLEENIADHTIKTLQETENKLINYKNQRTSFSVDL